MFKNRSSCDLQVLEGNNQFAIDLYKILSEKEGNVIFSPISIHAVLSMAYQGAEGTTAERLASALHLKAKSAAADYNMVINSLNSIKNVTLLMANKIFLMEGHELLPEFSNAVTKNFLSEVQLVDFGRNEVAAKSINDWVEEKTREKIKDVIQKDDLDAQTRLVLVNAIYFKGDWKHKFNKADTRIRPFFLNKVDKIDVHMMRIKERFNYKEDKDLDAQILELPYINPEISMIIILSNRKDGIEELEKKLANTNLSQITDELWNTEVNVALPRFKIEQTIDLKDSLTKVGLGEIFDQCKANFKGMIPLDPGDNLYVSQVVQKAFIEVNEKGAEAAAATVMRMRPCSARFRKPPEIYFTADHGFVFLLLKKDLREQKNHQIPLFMGVVRNPSPSPSRSSSSSNKNHTFLGSCKEFIKRIKF